MNRSTVTRRRGNLRRFLAYVRPHRGMLVLATVVGILKFNLPVCFPWILKDVIDRILAGKESALGVGLHGLMGLALALFLAYAAISYLRTFLADRLAQRVIFDVRNDLFRHLMGLPQTFFEERQTGAITSRLMTDVSMAQRFISVACTNIFMELSTLVAITCVVAAMDWKLALVAYSTLPFFVLAHRRLGARMRRESREVSSRLEAVAGDLHETVTGAAEVKSFTREEEETERFVAANRRLLEAAFANVRTHALSLGTTALLTRVPAVLVVWVGAVLVLRAELTVGELMAFYAYLEMVYNPLGRLSDFNMVLATSLAAIDRIFEFFDIHGEPRPAGAPELRVSRGEVRFEDVEFGYVPERTVLRCADLRLAPRSSLALVGPSGAGKSTLVKLLLRFHEPWRGRITIDGQDISSVDARSLRSRVAVVCQDPVLFSGTVAENIRFGRPGASWTEVKEAARRANALSFIEELPQGFETAVGERGVRLSGGQRQRLALARAFLKDAPILVLDESTSELDPLSEALVYQAIEELLSGRTALIIAHRLSTAARAGSVAVIAGGRVVQQGTHAALLENPEGAYYRLYAESLEISGGRPVG